jgi:glycosyltransferase involved in cell wall biosynthesis
MASLARGGGETFDLEISLALEKLGCEVHYLSGAPLFGAPPLPITHPNVHYLHTPYLPWFPWDKVKAGWRIKVWEFQWFERAAARWIARHAGEFEVIQVCELPYLVKRLKGERAKGRKGEDKTEDFRLKTVDSKREEAVEDNAQHSTLNIQHSNDEASDSSSQSEISAIGGSASGGQNPKSKIVLRLTAPNAHDPWGGIQLADAVIASGTSISKIRKGLRPDVHDIPNGVDLGRFKVAGCPPEADPPMAGRLQVAGEEKTEDIRLKTVDSEEGDAVEGFRLRKAYGGQARVEVEGEEGRLETLDLGLETEKVVQCSGKRENDNQPATCNLQPVTPSNIQHSTFNAQHSSGVSSDSPSQSQIQNLKPKIGSFRERHGIPETAPVLLYVARFQAFKNHKLLIEAFGKVLCEFPDARLVLAGSGPLMSEVRKMCIDSSARENDPKRHAESNIRAISSPRTLNTELRTPTPSLADRVLFLGEVPHEELPTVNQSATMAVISSEYESFCFAAIEAMACGVPVVTTDCGWVPKLIGDELEPIQKQWAHGGDAPGRFAVEEEGERIREVPGGMVVSRQEAESLARAIGKMIGDAGMRDACGRWNREKAEKEHGWESSARKLLRVYEEVTAERA